MLLFERIKYFRHYNFNAFKRKSVNVVFKDIFYVFEIRVAKNEIRIIILLLLIVL